MRVSILHHLGIIGVFMCLGLVPIQVWAQSYIEPSDAPPESSIAPPLNASLSAQRKAGTLIIGPDGGTQILCLNSSSVSSADDNCISSWASLIGNLGGPFVSLRQDYFEILDSEGAVDPLQRVTYQSQAGFARIRSNSDTQAFSTLVKSVDVCVHTASGLGCQDAGGGACTCLTNGAQCQTNGQCHFFTNLDACDPFGVCGLQVQVHPVGLFTHDSFRTQNNAAIFGGRVFLAGVPSASPVTAAARLCLNGTDSSGGVNTSNCILSWDALTGGSLTGYVKLQSNPPAEKQIGSSAVTGVGQVSTIIAGDASKVQCSDVSRLCGDGLCSSGLCNGTVNETAVSCPIDCANVPGLTFTVTPQPLGASFSVTTSAQSPSGNVKLLIVRATGGTISFTPQLGRAYVAGQVFGSVRVIYDNSVCQSCSPAVPPDSGLSPGTTYTYTAYQGNQFPRYGSGTTRTITTP